MSDENNFREGAVVKKIRSSTPRFSQCVYHADRIATKAQKAGRMNRGTDGHWRQVAQEKLGTCFYNPLILMVGVNADSQKTAHGHGAFFSP